MYETVFPSDILYVKDTSKVCLPPAPHENPLNASTNNHEFLEQYNTYNKDNHNVYKITTRAEHNKTTHLVISKRYHALLERDQSFVSKLKKSVSQRKCQLISEHTKLLTGAFASSHSQVIPNSIELCIAIAR